MQKIIYAALAAAGLILAFSQPGHAWHGGHFRGSIWVGPVWGPYWYAGPPAVIQQPVIIQQPADEYVQQAPQSDDQNYWYYCPDAKGYYPYVKQCPNGWMKVVPSPAPMEEEE